ncbi:uncharacterized protein LOC111913837 [Lactuca sativa]|uniref:uncharacterized protein LOC111913837 n=1 Tax=Lactuca sativa TaxID=4236 RepID=UPI000CD81767|nr:uncharacterized protein LOC111913837 [Lactuca sativa]
MGFGPLWRGWIMELLKSSRASVLVNGSLTDEFQIHHGLRQGDPLSPFLFILAMEGLHVALVRAQMANVFRGISISGIGISHLLYDDDVMLISSWDPENAKLHICILRCFFMASSFKINLYKSKLIGVGIPLSQVSSDAYMIGCAVSKLPFIHLGVPVGQNMSRISAWSPVFDRQATVRDRLTLGWDPVTFRRSTRGGIEQEKWDAFISLLQDFQLQSIPDRLGWSIDVSNTFSISSARWFLDGSMLYSGGGETRWNNWVPIKINILLWRIQLLSIPTRERLSHRGIMLDSILCPICSRSVESVDHLFTECIELMEIWPCIAIW